MYKSSYKHEMCNITFIKKRYVDTRTFEKFVWVTQTDAVIGVLHCD